MTQEKGNWKPYNVKTIASSVDNVFKNQSISVLSHSTFRFIVTHMGFIAHYDIGGFQHVYEDLRKFAKGLQTSEYGSDLDYNLREANRVENDEDFKEWYGEAYNKSKAQAIRKIVEIARKHESDIAETFYNKEKTSDLSLASALALKYGYKLVKGE